MKDEILYSLWLKLNDEEVCYFYRFLNGFCGRGYGSNEDMLICCKVCFCLKDRLFVEELDGIVSKWVVKCLNFEWVYFFCYMIYFFILNGSFVVFSFFVMDLIKKCDKIV